MAVTDKSKQNELEDWLPLFEGYLKTSAEGIAVFDSNNKIFYANKPLKKVFFNRWNIDLKKGLDLFNDERFGENYHYLIVHLDQARKGVNQKFLDTVIINDETLYQSVTARSFENQEGKLLGVALEVRDVTEYFDLSKRLSEREATLNAVLNATPDGIYALDRNLELIAINKQAINEFAEGGFKVNKGVNLHEIIEEEKLARWMETYFQKVFDGEPTMYEGPLPKIDGSTAYVQNKYRPVYNEDKEIVGILEISRDITEAITQSKIIDQQLEDLDLKNKELNQYIDSNLQLENFAYIASHDLKAPLRSVVSFAHLLKKRVYEQIDDKSKEFLNVVIKSSENMQMLIGDLLTYSRVKTEQIKLKELDLNILLERILMELDADLSALKVNIKMYNKFPIIVGDESLLIQLFSNLIRNAIKFIEPGVVPKIAIDFSEDDLFWKFSVTDNGIGIDESNFDKIFGTFEKLHSNDVYEGTGLGLTICKKIVEKHEGRMQVKSQIGEGTTFSFTIMKSLLPQERKL